MLSSNEFIENIQNGLKEINIDIDERKMDLLVNYKEMVLDWNTRINLTAIQSDKDFALKHFVDSLCLLSYIEKVDSNIIDVGTGAGFPGIPLKIFLNNLNVTLLDSLDKRVKFLNAVIKELKLNGINAVHSRAEDAGNNRDLREKFHYCTARAVASLPVLLEYCLPLVKVGGTMFAMKGLAEDEIKSSKKALSLLGGEIIEVKTFQLPLTDNQRNIIVIKKFRQTPTNYPRKAGYPSKSPLI